MTAFAIRGTVDIGDVTATLGRLKRGVRNSLLRPAISKASRKVILKGAKALCPVDTTSHGLAVKGLLKKSLGVKVRSGRRTVFGIIGPRKGFKTQVGVFARGKRAGQPKYQDPANIAHLVEHGHGGPHPAPPHPFMRPAWDTGRGPARQLIADEVATGLAKLAKAEIDSFDVGD